MINAKLIAYHDAPDSLFRQGKEKFTGFFPDIDFEFNAPNPEILIFLSGGSEKEALKFIRHGKFYLLCAFEENNSWAAATEVKAWLEREGIANWLIDLNESHDRQKIEMYAKIHSRLNQLQGQRLGLIGKVSEWLLNSDVSGETLKKTFGIRLERIPWSAVPDFGNEPADTEFMEKFGSSKSMDTEKAAQVHSALSTVIRDLKLDAITMECFPLVQEESVTACLSLSHLNDAGIPAGCEGDLVSIAGMMLVKAMTDQIPWMANLIKVSFDCVRFAHCTAPTALLDEFHIETHFETGKGTAISGSFSAEEVTVFRLNAEFNKAFLAEGRVISTHRSPNACRTQLEVALNRDAAKLLKHHPLGNHHLVIPGRHDEVLRMMCRLKGIEVIE
ncbi:MAG: hypothetical protein ACLFPE_01010 [Bacteroidales bacterium]